MKKRKKKKFSFSLLKLNKFQLIRRINTLELEKDVLAETIKDELFNTFMNKLNEPQEIERYRKENKRLREQVRTLKQLIKGDNNAENIR